MLIRSLKYIDGTEGDHLSVARALLGISSEAAFRLAVQGFINEAGLEFREFEGVGMLVACPRCGAAIDNLEGWTSIDYERDDTYAGARCKVCGWEDGSEI
jgi:DNA-directed RNA polymerase subunit RPC12/RpoP